MRRNDLEHGETKHETLWICFELNELKKTRQESAVHFFNRFKERRVRQDLVKYPVKIHLVVARQIHQSRFIEEPLNEDDDRVLRDRLLLKLWEKPNRKFSTEILRTHRAQILLVLDLERLLLHNISRVERS